MVCINVRRTFKLLEIIYRITLLSTCIIDKYHYISYT